MTNLGLLYEQGRGGANDLDQAKSWYETAANLSQLVAMTNLAYLYKEGAALRGITRKPERGSRRRRLAAAPMP
jgi:TPR repeat protein